MIVSAACTAITLCSTLALITMHLRRYSAPKEQRQIIRIVFAPFVFAIVSLAEIYDYSIARYIDPISSFYEAICLCALFLLYVQFAAPSSSTFGEELFDTMKAQQEAGTKGKTNWPRNTWLAVFQYPMVEVIAIIILEATEATDTYCSSSLRPRYGHFWFMVIHSVGIAVAVLSIFRFYGRMKALMRARRGLAKLTCFKAIVGVRFIQTVSPIPYRPSEKVIKADRQTNQWLFNILIDQDVLSPSSSFSYGDLVYGLPNALMCVETILFSAAFWYAFSSSEYSHKTGLRRLPLLRAVIDAANPYDLIHGVVRAVMILVGCCAGRRDDAAQISEPVTRSGRGRYRTLDGMGSLAQPERSRSRAPLQEGEGLEPPRYEVSSAEHLSADIRNDRSQSPGVELRYEAVRGRDMV
jgi:hypothetical protein